MYAAVNGDEYGDTFHLQNWNDKPHRVVYDAIKLLREAAEALSTITDTSGDEATKVYQTYDGQLFSTKSEVREYCEGRTYALGMMGWTEKILARPRSAVVMNEAASLRRALEFYADPSN
jgi:purine nucleoside phosphorylase